jgi:hypothetical protein
MARAVAALMLAVVACRPKSTPIAVADAAPAPAPAPAIVDAGAAPAFTLHSRFPAGLWDLKLYPLDDGIAVVMGVGTTTKTGWRLSTFAAGKPPRALSPRAPLRDFLQDDILSVHGTTDQVFVQLTGGGVLRIEPKGMTRFPHRYADIVELRNGQWIGLETRADPLGQDWQQPGKYELLAGSGTIPEIPSKLHPLGAVHLADGKICADAFAAGADEDGIWTADVDGHQYLAHPKQPVKTLFRGADGECYAWLQEGEYTGAGSGYELRHSIARVRGDEMDAPMPIDVAAMGFDPTGGYPRPDREGNFWFIGKSWIPRRVTLKSRALVEKLYPIPDKFENCDRPTATQVIAFDSNDVWVLASCRDEKWHFIQGRAELLLHTGPAGPVYEWPAP